MNYSRGFSIYLCDILKYKSSFKQIFYQMAELVKLKAALFLSELVCIFIQKLFDLYSILSTIVNCTIVYYKILLKHVFLKLIL